MRFRHIVASGCSQSQNGPGAGGMPPTVENPRGGCSFSGPDCGAIEPVSWVGQVAKQLEVSSLFNMAAAGHGNQFVRSTIIDLLERYPYPPRHTLVLFNVTYSHRLDVPCDFRHPDRSTSVPWTPDVLPYTWIDMRASVQHRFHEHIGNDQVKIMSAQALSTLFAWLERHGYEYRFLLGFNLFRDPVLCPVLERNRSRLIELDQHVGIKEFAIANDATHDACHPTPRGHAMIADRVLNSIGDPA